MSKWTQLFIRGPWDAKTSEHQAARADEHLQLHGAVFKAPDGNPIAEPDGTFEVRCYGDAAFPRFVLEKHYGFTVEREDVHE